VEDRLVEHAHASGTLGAETRRLKPARVRVRARQSLADGEPIIAAQRLASCSRLAWRQESQVALRQGLLRAPSRTTLEQAALDWLAAAEAGAIRASVTLMRRVSSGSSRRRRSGRSSVRMPRLSWCRSVADTWSRCRQGGAPASRWFRFQRNAALAAGSLILHMTRLSC